jgi:hypothetical protein
MSLDGLRNQIKTMEVRRTDRCWRSHGFLF